MASSPSPSVSTPVIPFPTQTPTSTAADADAAFARALHEEEMQYVRENERRVRHDEEMARRLHQDEMEQVDPDARVEDARASMQQPPQPDVLDEDFVLVDSMEPGAIEPEFFLFTSFKK